MIKISGFFCAIISFFALMCGAPASYAVVAKPGLLNARQPDGSEVKIRLEGDAHSHRAFSEDGYLLTGDDEGYYVFADINEAGQICPSNIREINIGSRSAETNRIIQGFKSKLQALGTDVLKKGRREVHKGPGLTPATYPFPSKGEQKAVVILVEFSDLAFTIANPNDYYFRMLNEENFSDDGGTGSARDYFIANSSGIFQPDFDVYGPVTLPNKCSYYGANNVYGNDDKPGQMVIDACDLLDSKIDFKNYDRNGDGLIDNVYIFYAGYGENDGGGSNTIWPHSWDVYSATRKMKYYDGKLLYHYACSNELQRSKNPDGIGTFCHEFSHVMDLPDLYATEYTNAVTPGYWNILDAGSYNNNSRTPPNYSAYERYALDWLEPSTLYNGECNLTAIGDSNTAFIIPTERENEFFLVENRQQKGFDRYLPGHGMLVWHIDYNTTVWQQNIVNNDPKHQYVDLLEAYYNKNSYTTAGYAFPGTSRVTSLDCTNEPGLVSWSGIPSTVKISDIKEANGIISFVVEGSVDNTDDYENGNEDPVDSGDGDDDGDDTGDDNGNGDDGDDTGDDNGNGGDDGDDNGDDKGNGGDDGDDNGDDNGNGDDGDDTGDDNGNGGDDGDDTGDDTGDDEGDDEGDDTGDDTGDEEGDDEGDDTGDDTGNDEGDDPDDDNGDDTGDDEGDDEGDDNGDGDDEEQPGDESEENDDEDLGVESILIPENLTEYKIYTPQGIQMGALQKGINILRGNDGSVLKILVK